jgi:hypothetical protein
MLLNNVCETGMVYYSIQGKGFSRVEEDVAGRVCGDVTL